MTSDRLDHRFVDEIPQTLDEGILYVSMRHRTASHLCPCGCRSRVATPIRPAQWHLTFDGDAVSLWPSVGNWQRPCRSHYIVRRGTVIWAKDWSDEMIEKGRARDQAAVRRYYRDEPSPGD